MSESFEDGELGSNPTWEGDTGDFVIEDGVLRLNAAEAGNSVIWSQYPWAVDGQHVWEFFANLDFSPSTSNQVEIILYADQASLPYNNALVIKWGETGLSDTWEIYQYTDGVEVLVDRGEDGLLADPSASLTARLTTDLSSWNFSTSYDGAVCLEDERQGTMSPLPMAEQLYFGLKCDYTTSRSSSFFFDNIIVDSTSLLAGDGPDLIDIEILSSNTLRLTFDADLDEFWMDQADRYVMTPSLGSLSSVMSTGKEVSLQYEMDMTNATSYTLDLTEARDCNGIAKAEQSMSFDFLLIEEAAFGDIRISEIMADPSPVVAQPEAEWIELYNRSDKFIQLSTLNLQIGNDDLSLSDYVLEPRAYVLITEEEDVVAFGLENGLGLVRFPGITNGGEPIALLSDTEEIDRVDWTDDWYRDADRDQGGYSLELIDPQELCLASSNWRASQADLGATPGAENSVLDDLNVTLSLASWRFVNASEILLLFNMPLKDEQLWSNLINTSALDAQIVDYMHDGDQILLVLDREVTAGESLRISLSENVVDCQGDILVTDTTVVVNIPFDPIPGDIVVNEILFDPFSGGADFIELQNISSKTLSLAGLALLNVDNDQLDFITEPGQIAPGEILVWTSDRQDILSRYPVAFPDKLYQQEIPAMNIARGNVSVIWLGSSERTVIDSFDYTPDLHQAFIDETKGRSLERVDGNSSTNLASNWHSASDASGGATPTAVNSQSTPSSSMQSSPGLLVENEVFSPNGDGYKDFLVLRLHPDRPSALATVGIYDAEGRQVRLLASNQLLGQQDFLRWSGENHEGNLVRPGIYVIFAQVFFEDGEVQEYKETCVLAKQLN